MNRDDETRQLRMQVMDYRFLLSLSILIIFISFMFILFLLARTNQYQQLAQQLCINGNVAIDVIDTQGQIISRLINYTTPHVDKYTFCDSLRLR